MQLPDFMKRLTLFADKAESHFAAESKLSEALAGIVTLEAEVSALKVFTTAYEAKITELTASLQKATEEVNERDTQIKALGEQVESAKRKSTEVIAAQGLHPDLLPSSSASTMPSAGASNPIAALRKQLAESTNAQEKYKLSQQIRDLSDKSKPTAS